MHKVAKKNKRQVAVLSSAAIGVLIAAAVSSNAQAAVKSYVVQNGDKYTSFGAQTLLDDYTNKLLGDASPAYDAYLSELATEPGLIAFQDDVKGYVSAEAVENAYSNALATGDSAFDVDSFTENASEGDILSNVNIGYEWKDGAIVPVQSPVTVKSVDNITKTDVTVKLADGFDTTAAADVNSYAIAINGAASVKPTAVTVDATAKTAKLSIALTGQEGSLKVNGSETSDFDFKKPEITSVQALNAKTIVVNYSEKVDSTTATNLSNYSLYNSQTGVVAPLSDEADADADKITATAAFTDASQKSVKITITSVGSSLTGYPAGGLSNGNYALYVSNVNDVATTPNTIAANSNVTFAGTTTPDTLAPSLISSAFNSANGEVTLSFDKTVTGDTPDNDKVYFQVGSDKVLLKTTDYVGIAKGSKVTFTVPQETLAKINALGDNPQIVFEDGAFKDAAGNTTSAVTSTPTIATAPILKSVTYDENTNTAVYKFSKTIDVTKITSFDHNFKLGGVEIIGAKFNNTANSTDLSFTLTDVNAQAVESALRSGTLTSSVQPGVVQDTDDTPNVNAPESSSVTLEAGTTYTEDTTAPTVTDSVYNKDAGVLAITFSEPVRNTIDDFDLNNIALYSDNNGTAGLQTTGTGTDTKVTDLSGITQDNLVTSTGTAATVGSESKTIYIKNEALNTALNAVPAANDIYVNIAAGAVKDANTNATTEVQTQKVTKVNISNTTAITDATTVNSGTLGQIIVNFKNDKGEVAVDSTTAANPANYNIYLKANPLSKVQVSSVTLNPDKTSATILFKSPVKEGSVYGITTSGIKTASGESADLTATLKDGYAYGFTGTAGIAPAVNSSLLVTDQDKSGTISAGDTIKATFSDPVKLPEDFDASKITVSNDHNLGNSTLSLSADQKTLDITVGNDSTIAVGDTLTLPETVKGYDGQSLSTAKTGELKVDGVADPKIASVVYSDTNDDGKVSKGDTLTVKFDQNVKAEDGANLKDDIKVGDATFSAAKITDDTLTLTIDTPDTIAVGVNADVDTTDTTPGDGKLDNVNITNVWGTQAASNATAIKSADTTAPTVTGISYKSDVHELTLNFSEAVNLGVSPDSDAIATAILGKLSATSGSLGTASNAVLSSDNKSVTITLDGESLDKLSTITINAGLISNIQDASQNGAVRGQVTYPLTIVQ